MIVFDARVDHLHEYLYMSAKRRRAWTSQMGLQESSREWIEKLNLLLMFQVNFGSRGLGHGRPGGVEAEMYQG
jgi:hypothetical protein